jgi:putative SbcD/Mre11-related phosphoesterase
MDGLGVESAVDGVAFRDRAVVIDDVLILADLHLGQADSARLELPVGNGADVVERLQSLLDAVEPATLVLAGDLLHSFTTVPHSVSRPLDGIAEAAASRDVECIALEGNHDTMLDSIWGGELRGEYRLGDTVVCHGHVEPAAAADRYVVGHDHPTIELEGRRRACYLAGDGVYDGADVLVLPAFSRLPRGVAVNEMGARDFQSPLVRDADAFAPIVWDDDAGQPLGFPRLGAFRHRL